MQFTTKFSSVPILLQ